MLNNRFLLTLALCCAAGSARAETAGGEAMFEHLRLFIDGTSSSQQADQCVSALGELRSALEGGSNPDAVRSEEGSTMLMYASWNGGREAVQLLLKHGADPNLTDADGETALMAAASMGWGKIAIDLLVRGADLLAKNKRGQGALAMAREGGYAKVVVVLEEAHQQGVGFLLSKYKSDL